MRYSADSNSARASYARLYATDASVYEQKPSRVVFPRSDEDCINLVNQTREKGEGLICRGGGTSIAGQCIGGGVVVDLSRHMAAILSVPEDGTIWVQPGLVLDDLNDYLHPFGWQFPIDISTSSRCTIGGMVGNNAAGSHSILYGTTRENVIEMDVVLADGSKARFGPLDEPSLREKLLLLGLEGEIYRSVFAIIEHYRDAIISAFPDASVIRRNTGYALDVLAGDMPWVKSGEPFNLTRLICGSEGTLALATAIRLKLSPLVGGKALACIHFDSLESALQANVQLLSQEGVASCELIDAHVLRAAADHPSHQMNCTWVMGDPEAILVAEFFADSPLQARGRAEQAADKLKSQGIGVAWPVLDGEDAPQVWAVRKAGLGLVMGVRQRARPVAVIEDSAVPVRFLPEFARDIKQLMGRFGIDCVFYGHASVGLLHLRPTLDLDAEADRAIFRAIAKETAGLVKYYRGSLSGEHGDGRLRAPYLREFLGTEVYALLEQVKGAFDSEGVFNPGKILSDLGVDTDLRRRPMVDVGDVRAGFKWREDNGFGLALERCNGSGNCRQGRTHGAMCPTFQATGDELYSTRGRANLLRQAFSQSGPAALNDPVLVEAMETCLGCKACRSECPSGVDMTRMKAEYLFRRHQSGHLSLRTRLIKHHWRLLSLFERIPVDMRTLLGRLLHSRIVMQLSGLERKPPMPAPITLRQRRARLGMAATEELDVNKEHVRVLLLVDPFVNHFDPEIGEVTLSLLQRLGYLPDVFYLDCSLRLLVSEGCLEEAKQKLRELYVGLSSYGDIPIIGLEPAELLLLREEAPALLEDEWSDGIISRCYLLDEFLLREHSVKRLPRMDSSPIAVNLHPHCHERAAHGHYTTIKMLSDVFGIRANIVSTGCCGMAGYFGYSRKKMSASVFANSIGSIDMRDQLTPLVASGGSCRHQFSGLGGVRPMHLSQLLLGILNGDHIASNQ